jgi:hypothetical protein
MKLIVAAATFIAIVCFCSVSASTEEASNYLDSYTLIDEAFGTRVTVTVGSSTRTIESNSLPNHETGEFPNAGNPNTITKQSRRYVFTTEPTFTGTATFAQAPGVAVNGVAFEPGTAESVSCGGENYRIEALQDLYNLGLDFNNAHVQPGGKYHYHGVSSLLVAAYATDDDLVHVGFAADGYLMYFSKSGAYRSSYQLATTPRTGSDCVASGPDNTRFDLEGPPPTAPTIRTGCTPKGPATSTRATAPPSMGSTSISSPTSTPISRGASTASSPGWGPALTAPPAVHLTLLQQQRLWESAKMIYVLPWVARPQILKQRRPH